MFDDYKKITVNFEEITGIDLNSNDKWYITVIVNDIPFEFLVNVKKVTDKLIVFGSGAYNRNRMTPPIFNRFSWEKNFECTTIFYNDPTLYLGEINLGWGYGNRDSHFLQEISRIINIFIRKLNITNENTLFFGSSGGGFTSMVLASILEGSQAFVNNPQTIITNYHKTPVSNLHNTVYGTMDNDCFSPERSNVIETFNYFGYVPKIFYAQNVSCDHDIKKHVIPFIKGLNELDSDIMNNKVTMYYYSNKEQGHNPLETKTTIDLIKKLLNIEKVNVNV